MSFQVRFSLDPSCTLRSACYFNSVLLKLQIVSRLGGTLPVVISSEDWERTAEDIDDLFIGDAGSVASCPDYG